jgi:hypothetical protein
VVAAYPWKQVDVMRAEGSSCEDHWSSLAIGLIDGAQSSRFYEVPQLGRLLAEPLRPDDIEEFFFAM